MNVYSHKVLDIIGTTTELENLENELIVEVSKLIRERLENSSLDFIGGNDLDILIDTNIDIESIVSKALIERKFND
mgnify:CR=1 FL=1|tara:strand:+ start:161 stop:388 length:228 start_codon:yes stop_codon:yes gene_type:complete